MNWLTALILGIVQGITEFLPISSSGHLAIGTALFGFDNPENTLAFVVFLHFCSVLAILVVFSKEIMKIFTAKHINILLWIIIGIIPAGILGIVFKHTIESLFSIERIYLIGIALIMNGFILLMGEHGSWGVSQIPLERLGIKNSLIVGIIQAIAIIPGISRSGSTISGGLICGLERKHAVAFSFFLAIPVILGATVMELRDFSKFTASIQPIPILIGGIAAFLVSIVSINILIRVVTNGKLYYFSIYCFLLGAIVLIAQIF